MRIGNEENYAAIDWPTRDEGTRFLRTLRERGILAANLNDLESKMKLVELGLTMPKGQENWLLFDNNREAALYIFSRLRIPARNRGPMHPGLTVFRFDLAKYRSNPLAPEFEVGDACALFCRSIAIVAGLDYMKGKLGNPTPQLN